MASRKTVEQVVLDFRAVHGDRYDYTTVKYVNGNTKVEIGCAVHGVFRQQPRAHLAGQGCPACNQSPNWAPGKRDSDAFIARAKGVHGDRYDYSTVQYTRVMASVVIGCPDHGPFTQLANSHLNGRGCPQCAGNQLKTRERFHAEARTIHGDKYDYGLVEYRGARQPVTIICPEHGEFSQLPVVHIAGRRGCPSCGLTAMTTKLTMTTARFVARARLVHGDQYDYSHTVYTGKRNSVTITCREHGRFNQRPGDHINGGNGCPKCAGNQQLTNDDYIAKARTRWGDRYNYSSTTYAGSKQKLAVGCPVHGEFEIVAGYHLQDGGCPTCALSSGQYDLLQYVKSLVPATTIVRCNDRHQIHPYELDVFLPDRQLAFEFHGDFHHSYNRAETTEERRRHLRKDELATAAGIKLIQIFEHEWRAKSGIIRSLVAHQLGVSPLKTMARKTTLVRPAEPDYRDFMNAHHLQGYKHADAIYGLELDGRLVSCMSFAHRNGRWEVERYATATGTLVVGGAGRLFAAFRREHQPPAVHTFANARMSTGGVYRKLGFRYAGRTGPNYWYLKSGKVRSRVSCQKHKLPKLLGGTFNPDLTEAENMFLAGYRRLWDAGNHRLIWHQG